VTITSFIALPPLLVIVPLIETAGAAVSDCRRAINMNNVIMSPLIKTPF
jgi:hypothetical protein